ncbi:sarcosine oxidase [Planotetraspora thailandica]|uniref:Sarcosine oxidase n=1 Tax=Planotetraspora thailandica TaxID=487172 RepID=A0A8J3Y0A1_9ACTN|nr:FAD-dependent oxidoreductase [Planotetraspora thailandica]GII58449.1 sarcosine oxidase [Planotetraspora thailandica]
MKSVIVVGAGIWGLSVALRLAESGWAVTLVEQYAPGHVRQASSGHTRLLRSSHGADEWYARMAWQARDGWRALGERAGEELLVESGLMWFAYREDGWERQSAQALKNLEIPHELLEPADAASRFPGMRVDDLAFVLWEPKAGVVRARDATLATARLARGAGVTFVRAKAVPYGEATGVVADGQVLTADRVVWACGAWLPGLFDVPMEVTRQDTFHFAVPREWSSPPLPAFCDYDLSAYGHGDIGGAGMKVTSDLEGEPYDPETGSRHVLARTEQQARDYIARRFPALTGAPVLFTQVCQYALTKDAEWIIAEVSDGVWLLGGDSGHGFKHAPALAAYVAEIVEGVAEPDPRFGLHERQASRGLRTSGLPATRRTP